MADFLLEIGLEEVPARMLANGEAELATRVVAMLQRERLAGPAAATESFSTPRRLAVLVHGVAGRQADQVEELLGPPVKAAFKNGVPTVAAESFARKTGVAVGDLRTVTNARGEYLAATARQAGKSFGEVVAAALPGEFAAIHWAKTMYWRAGKQERFVRPVQWIVALLDGEIVPVAWAGIAAGRSTFGHRVLHGPAPVQLSDPQQYRERLRAASVMASAAERKHTIRKALDRATRSIEGARWREDAALVEKLTNMTEWPGVLEGSFDEGFLTLPEEVLVTVMRDHQNNFAVEGQDEKLLPYFLAVMNTDPEEHSRAIIRHGNERVVRARFNDARFFVDFDGRLTLEQRVSLLNHVTFHKDLGSYGEKTRRTQALAGTLAKLVLAREWAVDAAALEIAARLAKTDLTTELVKEFTELQGIVGGLYARAHGHGEPVAQSIYSQYLPASMADRIPSTAEGLLLAIADRADTIASLFGLGLQPTGSRDPFALRRAGNGIVKILAESSIPLTLGEIATAASGGNNDLVSRVRSFFAERLESYLRESAGVPYDVVHALMATNPEEPRDAVLRARAVLAARHGHDFAAVAAAFKRMRNILEQARAKGEEPATDIDPELWKEPSERALSKESERLAVQVEGMRRAGDYAGALSAIATLRPHVDSFFESVMVMVPEAQLRQARLGLLERVLRAFSRIADFSEIVITG